MICVVMCARLVEIDIQILSNKLDIILMTLDTIVIGVLISFQSN